MPTFSGCGWREIREFFMGSKVETLIEQLKDKWLKALFFLKEVSCDSTTFVN